MGWWVVLTALARRCPAWLACGVVLGALVVAPASVQAAPIQPRTGTCSLGATEVTDDTQIQAAFATATDDSVICITAMSAITLSAPLQLDDTSLRFEGGTDPMPVLYGAGARQIMNIDYTGPDDDTLTIVNVQFSNGASSADGGALRIEGENAGDDALIVSGATFFQSTAALSGGALSVVNVPNVSLGASSQFLENTSTGGNGGGLSVVGSSGTVNIGTSFWQDDSAALIGGAIYSTLPVIVETSQLEDNTASGGNGGAIFATQAIDVTGSSFVGNASGQLGGALYAAGGSIEAIGTTFMSNQAQGNGGAVATPQTTTLVDDTFVSNSSIGMGANGGAVWSNGAVNTQRTVYQGNEAMGSGSAGGAIYSTSSLTSLDDSFSGNSADSGGGAFSGTSVDVDGSVFTGNSTTGGGSAGGALRMLGTTTIESATFNGNSTQGSGGAVWTIGATTVSQSTFLGNSAPTAGGFGGAVYNPAATVVVEQTEFSGNWAGNNGGAIWASVATVIDRATFSNNFSRSFGGGVWTQRLTASRVAFIGNGDDSMGVVRAQTGGAIYADDSGTLTNVTSTGNVAQNFGGLLAGGTSGVDLGLRYVTSVDDSAGSGSAIALISTGSVSITGSALLSDGPVCFDTGDPTPDFTVGSAGSYVTDGTCGLADDSITLATDDSLGFTTPITTDDTPGGQVLVPNASSILINRVASGLVPGVTVDQLGSSRSLPSGLTTVGARQVLPQPTFTTSPLSQTMAPGATATFAAAATGGTGALTLQWQRSSDGGTSWSPIGGASGASYTTGTLSVADSGTRYRVTATDVNGQVGTSGVAVLTVTSPTPPVPVPGDTPSPPLTPDAVAGDGLAYVTWASPVSQGSFPVTSYEVVSEFGGRACLVSVTSSTPLDCSVRGLVNGVSYRFRVRALNGAGWGAWSTWTSPVTPQAPVPPSLVITGSRDGTQIIVLGTSTGLVGASLTPRVRLTGQRGYRSGVVRPTVAADGSFDWQRRTGKNAKIYFATDDVRSNRVVIASLAELRR